MTVMSVPRSAWALPRSARALRLELKRSAVPYLLPLLAAVFYFDTLRTADGFRPAGPGAPVRAEEVASVSGGNEVQSGISGNPPDVRLTWLHLRSRRVPAGILALAVCGALLHAALQWHWAFNSGPYAQQVPLIIEAGAAAVIAVTAHSPFGETERSAGRWLPYLRLFAAAGMCGLAIALLQLGAAGQSLNEGLLVLAGNVIGITGIGLLCSLVTGSLLSWTLPMGYLAFCQYALLEAWRPRGPGRSARPPTAAPGSADARSSRPACCCSPSLAPAPASATTARESTAVLPDGVGPGATSNTASADQRRAPRLGTAAGGTVALTCRQRLLRGASCTLRAKMGCVL